MPAPLIATVVIPTLDEEPWVGAAVRSVREEAEVIVVDGGSGDRTREVAASSGARVVPGPPCRGLQLDLGARLASGDWLVFLHADTRLDPGWARTLGRLPDDVVGGALRFAVDSPRRVYRVIEAGVAWRSRILRLPYGDQGIFVRRQVYGIAGGFRPFPLLEDVDFVGLLGHSGRLALPDERALTSPRRRERRGLVSTTLLNWCILGLYAAGWSPARLARLYRRSYA